MWSLGEPEPTGGRADPALLRRHREVHAAARVVERRRLRPAGAALPRPRARRGGAALLGPRRRRLPRQPRLQVEQLHRPLPHAPLRPDGRARACTSRATTRRSTTWRSSPACRASSAWTARRCGARSARARIDEIRDYCETDVVNTWLLYLRFQQMRGVVSRESLRRRGRTGPRHARARRPSRTGANFSTAGRRPDVMPEAIDRIAGSRGPRRRARRRQGDLHRGRADRRDRRVQLVPAQAERASSATRDARRSAPRGRASSRAARTSACAAAARSSTPTSATQIAAKQRVLEDAFAHVGKVEPETMLPPIHGPGVGLSPSRAAVGAATCPRRAGCWSASTSAARATSPTCAAAKCCRATWRR